jgi:hypothetical protein
MAAFTRLSFGITAGSPALKLRRGSLRPFDLRLAEP